MSQALAALTVGQSPRDDVLGEMGDLLGGVRVEQCGALDGLGPVEIEQLAPGAGDAVLVSRLRDGTEVRLAERLVLPRLQRCVRSLEAEVDLFLVLCTGDLEGLESRKPMLFPGRILRQIALALGPGRVGVLTPAEAQVEAQRTRWLAVAPQVTVEAVSPYSERPRMWEAASRLARAGVDVVVMDCIGYTREMKAAVQAAVRAPVLLAATTLARVAAEILS